MLSIFTLILHVVNVKFSLNLILSVLFGPLASVAFEEGLNINFDKSTVGHSLRLHHLDSIQLLHFGTREDHTPTISRRLHGVALELKDHEVFTGQARLHFWYLFD